MFFLSSPLEQFQILPIISINCGIFNFSLTNATIILCFGLCSIIFVLYSLLSAQGNFYVAPNRIQNIFELIYSLVYGLLNDNVGSVAKSFFPYSFTYKCLNDAINLDQLNPLFFKKFKNFILILQICSSEGRTPRS